MASRVLAPGVWPEHGLEEPVELFVDDDDERVVAGFDAARGVRVVVSMRDVGAEVSAGFWDVEVARLVQVRHPSAALVLDARIVDDRFFVITTKLPGGATSVKQRLEVGPLEPHEAMAVMLSALEVAGELHALGLSASGIRLRAAMFVSSPGGGLGAMVTAFGLRVDNDVEVYNDLREIALRVLGLVGVKHERGGLRFPVGFFSGEIEALFRRAVGVEGTPMGSVREMHDALVALTGAKKRRVPDRVQVQTRPSGQSASAFGSGLLLAEELVPRVIRDE
ncbi:MAG: hypothetical protein JNJ59_22470 [Deltaproteobacteria bacterium]|jgi:hypothetical protein|nr:hypothetical protein [Deltaproteobacteria bacterium]